MGVLLMIFAFSSFVCGYVVDAHKENYYAFSGIFALMSFYCLRSAMAMKR